MVQLRIYRCCMNKLIQKIKSIPWWGWVSGFFYFGLQYGMYRLGELLSRVLGTTAWAFECKIPFIDDLIPIIPVFAVFYLYSYIFWICGPIAVSLTKKRNFINYLYGLTLAYFIGFLFFVFMPTYMNRTKEGLMAAVAQPGLFTRILGVIYGADGGDLAFNLFPSYHCLISLYCWLGVKDQPEISKGYQRYSLAMVICICMSTVFTKQHYIIDVFGGLLIAWGCWKFMAKLDPGRKHEGN